MLLKAWPCGFFSIRIPNKLVKKILTTSRIIKANF